MRQGPLGLGPVITGRLADQLSEDPIEVCQRLKTDLISDLAHPQVRIQQEVFRLLDANTGQIVGEMESGGFLESLAEIKSAGVYGASDSSERKIFGMMRIDEISRAADRERLGVLLLNGDLIAQH